MSNCVKPVWSYIFKHNFHALPYSGYPPPKYLPSGYNYCNSELKTGLPRNRFRSPPFSFRVLWVCRFTRKSKRIVLGHCGRFSPGHRFKCNYIQPLNVQPIPVLMKFIANHKGCSLHFYSVMRMAASCAANTSHSAHTRVRPGNRPVVII